MAKRFLKDQQADQIYVELYDLTPTNLSIASVSIGSMNGRFRFAESIESSGLRGTA